MHDQLLTVSGSLCCYPGNFKNKLQIYNTSPKCVTKDKEAGVRCDFDRNLRKRQSCLGLTKLQLEVSHIVGLVAMSWTTFPTLPMVGSWWGLWQGTLTIFPLGCTLHVTHRQHYHCHFRINDTDQAAPWYAIAPPLKIYFLLSYIKGC